MSEYALTYLSLGAGVQSSTLVEMMVTGQIEASDYVFFADTGNEPEWVYAQVVYLAARLETIGVPLIVCVATDNELRPREIVKDVYGGSRFAAMPVFTRAPDGRIGRMRRQCTRDYKIQPIEYAVKKQLLRRGLAHWRSYQLHVNKGVRVRCWLGISLDEVERIKPNERPWITNEWPLVDENLTREDCRRWLIDRGLPVPRKSSCKVCPFHSDAYLRNMRDNSPHYWDEVVFFDTKLRDPSLKIAATAKGELYLHRSCEPLSEVDLRTPVERGEPKQMDFLDMCDSGYCFV